MDKCVRQCGPGHDGHPGISGGLHRHLRPPSSRQLTTRQLTTDSSRVTSHDPAAYDTDIQLADILLEIVLVSLESIRTKYIVLGLHLKEEVLRVHVLTPESQSLLRSWIGRSSRAITLWRGSAVLILGRCEAATFLIHHVEAGGRRAGME